MPCFNVRRRIDIWINIVLCELKSLSLRSELASGLKLLVPSLPRVPPAAERQVYHMLSLDVNRALSEISSLRLRR